MATIFIQNENVENLTLKNDTGADLAQGQFTVIGGICVIANNAILSAASGSFYVAGREVIQVSNLETGEDTFATLNAPAYFNPENSKFSDTYSETYFRVGIVQAVKNANGVVLIMPTREVLLDTVVALLQAEPKILVQKITADASAGIAVAGLAEGDEIIGMSVICTAANASGTFVLETGAGDDITDGVICAVDTVVTYAGTIDDANSTLPATGAQILSVGGTAADTRGIVVITYIPVAV